jgi:hypothetical protein
MKMELHLLKRLPFLKYIINSLLGIILFIRFFIEFYGLILSPRFLGRTCLLIRRL